MDLKDYYELYLILQDVTNTSQYVKGRKNILLLLKVFFNMLLCTFTIW